MSKTTVTVKDSSPAPDLSNLTVQEDTVGFTSSSVGRPAKANPVLPFAQQALDAGDEKVRKIVVDTEHAAKAVEAGFKRAIPVLDRTIRVQRSQEDGKHVVRFQVLNRRILRPRKVKDNG